MPAKWWRKAVLIHTCSSFVTNTIEVEHGCRLTLRSAGPVVHQFMSSVVILRSSSGCRVKYWVTLVIAGLRYVRGISAAALPSTIVGQKSDHLELPGRFSLAVSHLERWPLRPGMVEVRAGEEALALRVYRLLRGYLLARGGCANMVCILRFTRDCGM